jgi:ribonuclease P protein component
LIFLKAKGMKYFRLKKQADFQKLFKTGKRSFSTSLTMIYRQADTLTMGISVGKRHGKSVKRNRIKRLIREAFRAENSALCGKYRIIFIPKVSEEYSFHTFQRDIRWIIKKEKL